MASVPVNTDLDLGGVARIRNLPTPANPDEPVRNDDSRLGAYTFAVGDSLQSTQAPTVAGQVWLAPGDYLRSSYPTLAAKIGLGPPLQTLEPMNIPRGGFSCIVRRASNAIVAASNSTATGNCICVSMDHGFTFRTYPAPAAFTDMCDTGTHLIAVANTTAYFRSADGAVWERITHAQALRSCASDGAGKVIFGTASTSFVYSTDHGATTITTGALVAAVNTARSVAYLGVIGSEFMLVTAAFASYTVNSSTWAVTARTGTTSRDQLSIGASDSSPLRAIASPPAIGLPSCITCNSSGLLVACGDTAFATSPDGINWTTRTKPVGAYSAITCNSSGLFVAVGGSSCATSPDGVNWTLRTIPSASYEAIACNSSDLFVAVGTAGGNTVGACATSPDGINWTARTIPGGTSAYSAITCNSSGLFVAVGSSCATSPDGVNWTLRSGPVGGGYAITCNSSGLFVAVGQGTCSTSPDGINWTARTIPGGGLYYYYAICCTSAGLFIAAGSNSTGTAGVCSTSPDGINWTSRTAPANDDVWTDCVIYQSTVFFIGNDNSALTPRIATKAARRVMSSVAAGTTAPAYLDCDNLGGAWTAATAAPAACRNFSYSANYRKWYGFNNTNASTALYSSDDGVAAWTTNTVSAYGIGQDGVDTADGAYVLAATNTTAGNAASNLQRLATASTFGDNAAIPHAGATSFAFGEAGGKMWACNAGANTIQQLMVNDGTGWRTQISTGIQSLADRIFDLGNNVAIITRGSNNILRTTATDVDDPIWSNTAVFANFVLHDAPNTITMCWDSGSGLRRSLNRMSTFPTITNPTALTNAGFTFCGHGVVFDGIYWFPGRDVQGYAAFAKSTDNGLTWSIESTGLDNSQFDFMATNGTICLALSKATGLVWRRSIGGSWTPAGHIAVAGVGFVDFLWASGRGQFLAFNGSGPNNSVQPVYASVDGGKWRGYGATGAQVGRGGYSPTLDRVFLSTSAASNTPIISEVITFDNATFFRLESDADHGASMKTYTRAS